MRNNSYHSSKGPYKSAVTGAYFGILNILLVFIPLAFSLYEEKILFATYVFLGILFLVMAINIIIRFSSCYNYDFFKIRYLYFTGTLFATFFLGIMVNYILTFGVSFSNIYIVILQTILIVMSSYDMIISAHNGMARMKGLYMRTIFSHYLKNALVIVIGILAGLIALTPYFTI